MKIYLNKFGDLLSSRQAGKEAWSALQPRLQELKNSENLEVDFEGVVTFSPSWGDEFLTPLQTQYGKRLVLQNTKNPSVSLSLKILQEANNIIFHLNG